MRILIAGGGIAGLGAALALSGNGRSVEVIERDPQPPEGGFNEIFDRWDRKGATQLRHSHAFVAPIVKLLVKHYPELRQRLLDAGVREVKFREMLWPPLRSQYQPQLNDEDIRVLTSRRTTLEAIMRTYAEKRSGAIFRTGYQVCGIVCERGLQGIPTAKAFKVITPGGSEELWEGDLLIDATGRNTAFIDWLREYGVAPEMEEAPAGIVYCTRHYRLHPGQTEPTSLKALQRGGDLGFIKVALFPGDGGNFSITISLPEIETKMRQVILDPEIFDTYARKVPGIDSWIDPERAFPSSKVFAVGNLKSVWWHWVKDEKPLILNFIPIGDARARTNPLYGRGCCIGMVHAHLLAEVLEQTDDPVAWAKLFDQMVYEKIRPFYDAMVNQDQAAIKRAENEQNPDYSPSFRERMMKSFVADAIEPAIRGSIKVTRAFMQSVQMLEDPTSWLRKIDVLAIIMATWATPKRFKKHLYLEAPGLRRSEFVAIAEEKLRARANI